MSTTAMRKPWEENSTEKDIDGLRVIGAGLPRTGTTTMKAALEILGFSPCHHMRDAVAKLDRTLEFTRAYNGEKVDFRKLMQGYKSAIGAPTCDFLRELREIYPQAKIILTVRDTSEKWFKSYQDTVGALAANKFDYYSIYLLRYLRIPRQMQIKSIEVRQQKYGPIDPGFHDRYKNRIINDNKGADILVYNVKEGWEPLCKYLKVDIPQGVPFPHVHDTEEFLSRANKAQIRGICSWILLGALIILLLYFGMRII